MDVLALFRKEGQHLFWHRLGDERVIGRASGEPIEADQAYLVIRLAEMYLGTSRVLWRKFSPLVHSFVGYGDAGTNHAVAGPAQLQDLGEANLDRVLVLNFRLVGPIPYKGGELSVLTGLYSVPRDDAAAALVGALGALSGLGLAEMNSAARIAGIVKGGLDRVLDLDRTKLRLGVSDSFGAGGNALRTGYLIAAGAPEERVPVARLWLKDGRLFEGMTAATAAPLSGFDYFVLQLERLDRRADWPGLPGIADFEGQFSRILGGAGDVAVKKTELSNTWPAFLEVLAASPHLTSFDAGQIANDVKEDLRARVAALESGRELFETRSWGGRDVESLSAADVDFGLVPVRSGSAQVGENALREALY